MQSFITTYIFALRLYFKQNFQCLIERSNFSGAISYTNLQSVTNSNQHGSNLLNQVDKKKSYKVMKIILVPKRHLQFPKIGKNSIVLIPPLIRRISRVLSTYEINRNASLHKFHRFKILRNSEKEQLS